MALSAFFGSSQAVFSAAVVLRAVFLVYGLFQDAYSPMKYTDIDYFVFTDAARFIAQGQSPYARDTYRYTPLLAWLIYPTTWLGFWFSFGKVLFAVGDIVTGWMMFRILRTYHNMSQERALKYASIWLLNPMVATISTRGSSEGLLGVLVTVLLWAVLAKRVALSGFLLGFAVHFKIYPFIYAASIIWWLDDDRIKGHRNSRPSPSATFGNQLLSFLNPQRLILALCSLLTFMVLNMIMYLAYGWPFLEHSYFYHLIRIDHRHNFSPYNTLLYLNSSPGANQNASAQPSLELERLAFLPQILLSAVLIPLVLSKRDLPSTMLAQTFAFVAFNKVCTSQYFLWYMMFLPYYLPDSTLLHSRPVGISALILWVLGQVFWLQQGFQLEFNGYSTFVPGLWLSGIFFFIVNVGILGIIIRDVKSKEPHGRELYATSKATKKTS
ncbi:GPI mannosyltransferase 1 [Didymosphaeria variabile]|uniref:GPI mannosyltransferase 1 n=1 Tax=Didymosphaeria variabile TaxID=1932322 RepID=A0A9W8XTF1_9PLEO|nr:GPI mannosyltransferase 1 [Didymosphaeria variabile]KAJ4357300.1 GPI mannosyltransferase 1 [Didymosphaeria variabile]